MQRAATKTTLCRHGPSCARYGQGRCWLAHSLMQLRIPAADSTAASLYRNHKVDRRFGQVYSVQQYRRFTQYLQDAIFYSQDVPDLGVGPQVAQGGDGHSVGVALGLWYLHGGLDAGAPPSSAWV